MSLYVIGDLHLSLGTDKPMDIFKGWNDYIERLQKGWNYLVTDEDTVVIPGDVSWGMNLQESLKDFLFLDDLPGKKLLLKGNHDYWWTTRKKMDDFFYENYLDTLTIVHNDAVRIGDYTVCGTRGWFYDAEDDPDKKVVNREAQRLRTSISCGRELGGEIIAFLHYPPFYDNMLCEEIYSVLVEEHIKRCYYGHLHGASIGHAFNGIRDGIKFRLVSADSLGFVPLRC